jgi:undecaprenyl phosphate N,N'-diacetylbacillosamine 1-phosphate transferase
MYVKYIKRVLDIILALIIGIIFMPIGLVAVLAIKLDSQGPAFYKQERTGKNGKKFLLFKFRSMAAHNNVDDPTLENHVTKIGVFIRKYSIDELPQIINIIIGNMSFIGPRPWIPEYYKNMTRYQRQRCIVLPGITGLAQASGRNALHIRDKIKYDLQYVNSISLKQDIIVVYLTLKTIFEEKSQEIEKSAIYMEIEHLKLTNRNDEEIMA